MHFLKTVKSRLLLISVFPLVTVVAMALYIVFGYFNLSQEMKSLDPTIQVSIRIGALLHETQKERGITAAVLGDAEGFEGLLDQQRVLVDKQVANLKSVLENIDRLYLGQAFQNAMRTSMNTVDKLSMIRRNIDNRTITTENAIAYFSSSNALMIDVVKVRSSTSNHQIIRQLRLAYVSLLQLKEKAGQERAILSSVFSSDRFGAKSLGGFSRLVSEQESFENSFLSTATQQQVDLYRQKMNSGDVTVVAKLRQTALAKLANQDKTMLLSKLFANTGYGGAIHQFKNFVLRQDLKYAKRFSARYDEIIRILDKLDADENITLAEKEKVTTIRKTFNKYNEAIATASKMINDGATVSDVDSVIKISDGPAVKALNSLAISTSLGNFNVDPKRWFDAATKRINSLKSIEDSLANELSAQGKLLGGNAWSTLVLISLVSLIIVAIVLAGVFLISRSIIKPLQLTTVFAKKLSQGDLTTTIDYKSDDEMGQLTLALNVMVDSFRANIEQVNLAIEQLSVTAEQTSSINQKTSKSMQIQLAETTTMSAAISQLNAVGIDVSKNTTDASSAATAANTEADTGKRSMEITVSQIKQLSSELQSSAQVIIQLEQDSIDIGEVLDVIKTISDQTNLLALNAAIEAARAGEHGRGFAVVADEVRTFASRTQDSAEEISQMITKLQTGAKNAVAAINRGGEQAKQSVTQATATGENLATITDIVRKINDMNSQIAAAVVEQGEVADNITQNIGHINDMAKQTVDYAKETHQSSDNLIKLTLSLKESAASFKTS